MKSADTVRRGGVSALLQSYAADLHGWASGIASGYAVAVVLLVAGAILALAAAAVGIAALFHFIELNYGPDTAYEAIGGGLLVLGAVLMLAGVATLRRKIPPLPRPQRQMQAAKRMVVGSAAVRALSTNGIRSDPITQLLIGAAATVVVGWMVASRVQGRRLQK
jgi:hypothetical protein